MRIFFYSVKDYEQPYLMGANKGAIPVHFCTESLSPQTAVLCSGFDCVSVFANDDVSAGVIDLLHANGVRFIAARAAGYDNIDLKRARSLGIRIANVPEYSPWAIAEHAVAMMLCLNRKLIVADRQVHQHNFTTGRLVGFDLHGKTVGIIGAGRIGGIVAGILHGFGCRLLAYDICPNAELIRKYHVNYTGLRELCMHSDIITIHTPLLPTTKGIISKRLLSVMRSGVMIINTARGAVVNTADIIEYLEKGTIGYYGMDVYEKEKGIFFFDHSGETLQDDMLNKLLHLPNVLVTPHQAFATREALTNIADTTYHNIACWGQNIDCVNEIGRNSEERAIKSMAVVKERRPVWF